MPLDSHQELFYGLSMVSMMRFLCKNQGSGRELRGVLGKTQGFGNMILQNPGFSRSLLEGIRVLLEKNQVVAVVNMEISILGIRAPS